ncbi:MAG: hypothetical protein QNJ97_16945 [Myxococcota bacterium]|nr:hypothetical protein [Myxococcota bacterium]
MGSDPRYRVLPAFYLLIGILFVCTVGRAEVSGGFSKAELKTILPLLKQHGVVALAETHTDGSPKAMTLAIRINAPRKTVIDIFEDPLNFYYISTLFKENKVLQTHANTKAYSWASRHKWINFIGTNTITLYRPRRVDVSIEKSSLGAGDFRMLFYEDGKETTIMVISGILDVKSSEWLVRFLVGMNPSMRLAMNIAIGLVVVKGVKTAAERVARGKSLKKHKTRGKREGPLKPLPKDTLTTLAPLLGRGTVILTDSVAKGRMTQATAIERIRAPAAKFLVAAATPELYPKFIKAISKIEVHRREDHAVEFSWDFGFSLFNLTSRNRLTFAPDGVLVNGLSGDLGDALWRWQVIDDGPENCIVAYHGWANMKKAGYILEKSVKREPYLEHGLMAGSNMVMLRALKRVVEIKLPKKQ